MKVQEQYQPEWINVDEACKWLGVDRSTLFRWRTEKGLAWTNINKRAIMYDKKQIEKMLFENSTYAFQGNLR
jgi:phage antirepressor YoqD-like protein